VRTTAEHVDHVCTQLSADDTVDDKVDSRVDGNQDVAPVGQMTTVVLQTLFQLIETQLHTNTRHIYDCVYNWL